MIRTREVLLKAAMEEVAKRQRELSAEIARKYAHGMTKTEGGPNLIAEAILSASLFEKDFAP